MALTLTIENETSLPDGGPLSVTVSGKRGLDLGRDQHLDWTLPDPSRFLSGKHCEIRYRDGGYWLYDVSTNGTFLNGAEGRLKGPYRLRNGDRLGIGHYIVAVTLDGEDAAESHDAPPQPVAYHELWKSTEDAAPPLDRALLRPPAEHSPLHPDFLDWATDVPESDHGKPDVRAAAPSRDPWDESQAAPAAPAPQPRAPPVPPQSAPGARQADDDLDWARGATRPQPVPEPPPAIPSPRRPVSAAREPREPWSQAAAAPYQDAPVPPQQPVSPRPEGAPARVPPPVAGPPVAHPEPLAPSARAAFPGDAGETAAFVRRLAQGAGVPEHIFTQQHPDALAEQLGMLVRATVEHLRQLLQARLQAKRLARSTNQTMVEAFDNNPLKFSPTAEDAMRLMFGPPNRSYLDAQRTLEQSFDDLKAHQIRTYAAMQQALRMLLAEFDPQTIESEADTDRGLAGMVGSRKARLWDAYQARWQAKATRHEGGLIDAFMLYFADCYDHGGNDRR
jgi:type VI secretion system protein ImpI